MMTEYLNGEFVPVPGMAPPEAAARGIVHQRLAPREDAPDMSILNRHQATAPTFPVEIFDDAACWITTTAASKSAPVDYVALSLLVASAAVIGGKRRVSPWDGWEEPSILWGVAVGDPSSGKSPAMDPVRDAMRHVEIRANAGFEARLADHATTEKIAQAAYAEWEKSVSEAVKKKKQPPEMPADAVAPKTPTRERVWTGDATTEQLARLLGENHGGIICFRDELVGLLGGFDRYGGSGSDRAFWLEAYGGRSHRYDRVGLKDGAIDIPYCGVSLLGGVQPDKLDGMILSGPDDGLAARPIYAWPDPVQRKRPIQRADEAKVRAVLARLHALPWEPAEIPQARVVKLAPDAADEFQGWWEYTQWDRETGPVAGAIGKLPGTTLRIAHTLEFLAWAWSGSNQPEPTHVTKDSIVKALTLVNTWVRPTLARVFAEASLPEQDRDARAVAHWLLKTKPKAINAKVVRRSAGFPGPKDPKKLDQALGVLVEACWLIPDAKREGGTKGRRSKDYWVHASIHGAARADVPPPCR